MKSRRLGHASQRINSDRLLRKRNLPDLPGARRMMVERLRKMSGVSERVLAAMADIPRHAFAPPGLWQMAYADTELWGWPTFLARPSVMARLATYLEQRKARKVLEYATWTGYFTTILAHIAETVDTAEHNPWLLWLSSDAFRELELDTVAQKASDGRLGWPERAPYDAIAVGAGVPRIPVELIDQLELGGVCVAPVGPHGGPHRLLAVRKSRKMTSATDLGPCYFPPLLGAWSLSDVHLPVEGAADELRELERWAWFWTPWDAPQPGWWAEARDAGWTGFLGIEGAIEGGIEGGADVLSANPFPVELDE